MNFKAKGVCIEVSFWFTAVVTLALVLFPQSKAAMCFLFCAFHELGHLTAMLALGVSVREIKFGYFGVKIVRGGELISPAADAAILLSGPAVNLFSAAACGAFGLRDIAAINLVLGLFNLIPVSVLDGGRIIKILVPRERTYKAVEITVCAIFILFGIATALYTKGNLTLLIVSLYLLTGAITQKQCN